MTRYISTISYKEHLASGKCHDCGKVIRDQQAMKANNNASIVLKELDL